MNTRLHAVADARGRPLKFSVTAGQVSDHTGTAALPGSLTGADWPLADRGHDADWYRQALTDKGGKPCIPGRKSRGKPVEYDECRYRQRNRIKIMFGRLKGGNPLRQMSRGLRLRRRARRNRHVLALKINESIAWESEFF